MSSFCTAKATHIFFSKKKKKKKKKNQHICVSLDVNFNESLTNDVVSFEQLGPGVWFEITVVLNKMKECKKRIENQNYDALYIA